MYPMRRSHGAEPGRRRSRTVVLTLAAVLLVGAGTSACQVSTKAADRIELCAKIFGKTFTDPFPDNVEEARKKMRDRADELDGLAKQAGDDKLRNAIQSTADKMRNADIREKGAVRTVVGYIGEQNDRIKELRQTCLDHHDYP